MSSVRIISASWEMSQEDRIPVAVMYCASCQQVTDLVVGELKDRQVKGVCCPGCRGHAMVWMNSFKPKSSQGCIFVCDEFPAEPVGELG